MIEPGKTNFDEFQSFGEEEERYLETFKGTKSHQQSTFHLHSVIFILTNVRHLIPFVSHSSIEELSHIPKER